MWPTAKGLSGTAPHPLTYCNAGPGARCCVNTDKSNRATNRGSWELPLGQLPGKCDRSAGVTCPCPAPSWVSVKASVLGQFLWSKGLVWHLSWHHGLIGVCAGGMRGGRACTGRGKGSKSYLFSLGVSSNKFRGISSSPSI